MIRKRHVEFVLALAYLMQNKRESEIEENVKFRREC